VTSIGTRAFGGCISLTSVTFATGSAITSANFGQLAFPQGTQNNNFPGDNLKTAYLQYGAGTYKRASVHATDWTLQE